MWMRLYENKELISAMTGSGEEGKQKDYIHYYKNPKDCSSKSGW